MGCISSKNVAIGIRVSNRIPSSVIPTLRPVSFIKRVKGSLSSDYEELKTIGSGAFSEVKLCIYKPTQEKRAVKFIHKAGLYLDQMDSDFQLKEISIITSLDHPNILRCFEIYEDDLKFYVVTEYCEGGELFEKIIKWKRFTEEQASLIFYQLMSAVAYCHEKNVIHRDLKPENILLEEKGESLSIKVVDFGSSCFLDPKKNLQNLFGTAYYIAPEVLRGNYNEKCDIWSCGVVLFVLLTGKAPYPGKDNPTILKNVKNSPLKVKREENLDLSESAFDLLQQMLTLDYYQRISATEVLMHPWIQSSRKLVKSQNPQILSETLKKLASFTSNSKLKDAVYTYLSYQIISHEELKRLKKEFQFIDSNGDGRITRDELMEQYIKTMDEFNAYKTVDSIMREVDTNENGEIDYHEFLKACMNHQKIVSLANLESAFALFDKDGSGEITLIEIKSLLGDASEVDESVWVQMIKEADDDGDGKINLKEFIRSVRTRKYDF
jgi:calcium-dependent protein kinase